MSPAVEHDDILGTKFEPDNGTMGLRPLMESERKILETFVPVRHVYEVALEKGLGRRKLV